MAGEVRKEELIAKAVIMTSSKCRRCQTGTPSVLQNKHMEAKTSTSHSWSGQGAGLQQGEMGFGSGNAWLHEETKNTRTSETPEGRSATSKAQFFFSFFDLNCCTISCNVSLKTNV